MNKINQMNKNMLEGDDVWTLINDDLKIDEVEESFTHDIESGINKRIQQIRLEVLFTLNHVQKEAIFEDNFSPF
jgi:hypothetical protein